MSSAPPIVHDVLRSPGRPLDAGARAFMEPRFGHDFSQVRVHADAKAAESARAVSALAYTVGRDIVFGEHRYQPSLAEGRRLLTHELIHVVQQSHFATQRPLSISRPDTKSEMETKEDVPALLPDQSGHPGQALAHETVNVAVPGQKTSIASCASSVSMPLLQREATQPRAATGKAVISDVTSQTSKLTGALSAGTLARTEWESLFRRHFTEPDKVEGEVESSHARYFYSRIYGWIDAQHFFAHIEFAENEGLGGATTKGIDIEKKQQLLRKEVGPEPDDPSIYSDLLKHNLATPDDLLHYRESTFIALSLALDIFLSKREKDLIKGFSEEQLAKFLLDNAMSAWSYEDLVSNQLGVQFFRLNGAFINLGMNNAEVRARFTNSMEDFFQKIQVVNDPAAVKRLAKKLPGKERWTAPKMDEVKARKKFPELFRFEDLTHRVRIGVYDREEVAERKRDEIAKLVPSAPSLRVESYGGTRFALYTGSTSQFEAVALKWAIDRAIPTGNGGALVEAAPPAPAKKTVYGPEP